MGLVAGQSLGRYEIISHLGAGGMGVVYHARDTELGRDVAIKVLNEQSAGNASRIERFAREARAVASLSHPNILDIHDFGTHEGIAYAVTELLHGSTLYERLRKGAIPIQKGLEICSAIAEGLAAAHSEGVIHRDIKPSNIFITDTGQVKILDFGIARLREKSIDESRPESEAPTESAMKISQMAGTVGYMSPEQIEGRAVDGRSDIFGLGCVMYEVLSGARAFRGQTASDTMLAILTKDPEPIRSLRPDVQPTIEMIVRRCLEKQPGERFESARDVAFAIQAITGSSGSDSGSGARLVLWPREHRWVRFTVLIGTAAAAVAVFGLLNWKNLSTSNELPDVVHLGVVPFEASNGGEELSQLAAGLSEILVGDLALLEPQEYGRFWIVPWGDAQYMGVSTVEEMYRVFNPTVVLTGRLDRRDSRIRLNLAALNPQNEATIKTRTIEADLGNVSSIQLDPVLAAAVMLGVEFDPVDRERLIGRTTNVAPAYEFYVRGRGILGSEIGGTDTDLAINLLEESVAKDPLFAPARETLAQAFTRKFQETREPQWYERALSELERVLGTNPSDCAYRRQGELYTANGQVDQAVGAFLQALNLDPTNSLTLFQLGRAYQRLGRTIDAEDLYQKSINLRPGYWPGPNRLANLFFAQGRFDAAANAWREVTENAPLCVQGYNNLGATYSWLGRKKEALAAFQQSIEVEPKDNYAAYSNLGTLFDQEGRFADAVEMYEHALAIEDSDYQVWGNFAFALVFSAQSEKAVEPFNRAIALAQQARASDPSNSETLSRLAGYYVMIGDRNESRHYLNLAEELKPTSPNVFATIGETYEDLGERETALFWIGRALEEGVLPGHFENRPMLRDLVSDERYRRLVAESTIPQQHLNISLGGE